MLRTGIAPLVIGVAGTAANLWARSAYPEQWGGPNIGGGALQVLCYLAILVGLVLVWTALTRRRHLDR